MRDSLTEFLAANPTNRGSTATVEQLPADIVDQIDAVIDQGGVGAKRIIAWVHQLGHTHITLGMVDYHITKRRANG